MAKALPKYGEGVTQDYKQALHWYRKTAKQGDSDD
ncbi:MAG: SEL1-like repeat protein [Pedosphaera sp.]|nr:SEL1-like repeat protein [Pedosphaera sp.]